jgi:hypothetical protein
MKGILIGIILTLAVLNPGVTKNLLGGFVDTTHNVVAGVIDKSSDSFKEIR